MPYAQADGAKLYYEEAGIGYPIVFVHEFGADLREWETQLRWFARYYRCIAFNARGYPPSDVPTDPAAYGYERSAEDIGAVMRATGVERAHVVGLSMGAYAALIFGLRHPGMASSLVIAGCGSGSLPSGRAAAQANARATADRFLTDGSAALAQSMGVSGTRVQLLNKDPRGWASFVKNLSEHSAEGSASTMRYFQGERPSLFDFAADFAKMTVPVLLAVGDEDEPCLEVNLFLKRTIPSAGLWMAPRTGHAINLEEPAAFNQMTQEFLGAVERGKWGTRDPRSAVG